MAQEEIIFPNNIRNIRLANGMKMTELARQANLSLSAVSKIEKGVRRLNQKQLLNICNILGCKLSDIFIKESDEVADQWQSEIKRRLNDNEDSGLKIFGSGLRKIRQQSGKTIAQAAKDAGMVVVGAHIEGMARRTDNSDEKSIEAVMGMADVILVVEDSDSDGFFTDYAAQNNKPLIKVSEALDIASVITE